MQFTHLNERGDARMVDVTAKQPTVRAATLPVKIPKPEARMTMLTMRWIQPHVVTSNWKTHSCPTTKNLSFTNATSPAQAWMRSSAARA